jgi:hypothetical protein
MSETVDAMSNADEAISPHVDGEARRRRSQADAGTGETPSDTIADSGVEGGVDAPNEGTDNDQDSAVSAN